MENMKALFESVLASGMEYMNGLDNRSVCPTSGRLGTLAVLIHNLAWSNRWMPPLCWLP